MRIAMPVGHAIVCARVPIAPTGYFIRSGAFAARWTNEGSTAGDAGWQGRILSVRLRGEHASGLDAGMRADLEKLAQRNAVFVIWIDGAVDDSEGWKVIKEVAHEIAIDTGGALLSLLDRSVLDAPALAEVDAAKQASLDAFVEVDRAIAAVRRGDGGLLTTLVDVVLEEVCRGRTRPAALVAVELVGLVSGGMEGDSLRIAAEHLARIAQALDSGRVSAIYPALAHAHERLGNATSSALEAVLADRGRQEVVLRAIAWGEENPPSRADVVTICAAACGGSVDAIAKIRAWALRFPAAPASPLTRDELGERLAFVGPFCAAVKAAPTLDPEIWNLANAVMGPKLVESGGTLAALRAKLPKESGA
jgi:hypothetical protein